MSPHTLFLNSVVLVSNIYEVISCAAFLIGVVAVLSISVDYQDGTDPVEESEDDEEDH